MNRSPGEALTDKGGLVPIAVVREEEVLPPGDAGPLRMGDRVLIAANDEAYAEFMRVFGQTMPRAG